MYVGLGDGGKYNDAFDHSQNLKTFKGSILRLDVDGDTYTIPSDNPFVGNSDGYKEEIFAYGFRNPWMFSFDSETGDLWVGDVGQDKWEEIDVVIAGGNYGWAYREGTYCFDSPFAHYDDTRVGEKEVVQEALNEDLNLQFMPSEARMDGGDVLQFGDKFLVGHSSRTNKKAIECLREFVTLRGFSLHVIEVPKESLHLKPMELMFFLLGKM